jgi:hypothetical protein
MVRVKPLRHSFTLRLLACVEQTTLIGIGRSLLSATYCRLSGKACSPLAKMLLI